MLSLCQCNPYLRVAMIQSPLTEGTEPRIPFDHRIFFIYEGTGTIWLNDRRWALAPYSLVFLGLHDSYYFKGKFRAAVLNFDMTMACCKQKTPKCPVPVQLYDVSETFDRTTVQGFEAPIVLIADEDMKDAIDRIIHTYIRNETQNDARCSALLKLLLSDIRIGQGETQNDKALLSKRILSYIRDNAAALDSNRTVGDHFGYHHVYLAKLFKEQTGKTLHAVIAEEKLRIASRLLIYTNDSVEEISYKAGFPSRNHFCTSFKKCYGCTPLSYRNSYRVKAE